MNDWTGEEILALANGLVDGMMNALQQMAGTLNETGKNIKRLGIAMRNYKYNNWRKFHHIPMKRRGA